MATSLPVHFAGANAGRAIQPTCTPTATFPNITCSSAPGQVGELQTDLPALRKVEKANTTPFDLEPQAGVIHVNGQPGPADPGARQLERDAGSITASNPYSGIGNEPIANYLADPTEERILHDVTADPARTPTFTLFPKPDYYFTSGTGCTAASTAATGSCVTVNPRFAYNHSYYAPEINNTWLGLVGPGVATKGVDGPAPSAGASSAGPNSGNGTVPATSTPGTWADHTDIRPTTSPSSASETTTLATAGCSPRTSLPDRSAPPPRHPASGRWPCATSSSTPASARSAPTPSLPTPPPGTTGSDGTYQAFASTLTALADQRDTGGYADTASAAGHTFRGRESGFPPGPDRRAGAGLAQRSGGRLFGDP